MTSLQDPVFEELFIANPNIPADNLAGLEEFGYIIPIDKDKYEEIRRYISEKSVSFYTRLKNPRGLNQTAFKAYLLFRTPYYLQSYERHLQKMHKNEAISIEKEITKILFPPYSEWKNIDFKAWGQAFIECGEKALYPFRVMSPHIAPVKNTSGRISLWMTRFRLNADHVVPDKDKGRAEKLLILSRKFNKTIMEYDRALKLLLDETTDAIPPSPSQALPDLVIDGADFGIEGAVFKKMDRTDPRLMYLGHHVNSCEKVTDQLHCLEKTVTAVRKTDYHGYYIVEKDDDILTSSWALRGIDRQLVLDGFESFEDKFGKQNLRRLVGKICQQIQEPHFKEYGINGLLIGQCAQHLSIDFAISVVSRALTIPPSIDGIGMKYDHISVILPPRGHDYLPTC